MQNLPFFPKCLFVIRHVGPAEQEIPLFQIAFDGLGGRHNGHPFLHIAFVGAALSAEHVQIILRDIRLAPQMEGQISARHIGRGIALGGVGPVKNVVGSPSRRISSA